MDLFEHQGKDLFAAHGIRIPQGVVAETAAEARDATADQFGGRSVVKVQVQIGGRGKGGGVVLVDSPERAETEAARMLSDGFKDMPVNRVLVEEQLPIASEFYAAITLDRSSGDYLAMVTAEGGMDIEEVARVNPAALRRRHFDPMLGPRPYQLRYLTETLPVAVRADAAELIGKLYEVLTAEDATLVEVNPLVVLEDGSVVALDSKITIDDNALFRHPETAEMASAFPIDPTEARAKAAGLQYVKLDGSVGIIGNGAGLVMSTLDVVKQAGGEAANFLDIGGGASAEVMSTSLEVILSDPNVKSVLVNIFGGITRCDLVAAGIVEALGRVDARVQIVVRLDGTNAEEGRKILADANHERVVPAATMLEAAEQAARFAGKGA